ncbi:MAG: hypothetical protein NVV72_04510 [Asticcacaulis sp.]|nr:hypothetical protein [Asticcacaulis sp.]
MPIPFEKSVFINCPFDPEFAPLLQAVAFCVTDLGFYPRLAPENADNAANRLDRIIDLIRESKFAIHDLSRCKSISANEYSRLNMPFELGIDHGARRLGENSLSSKAILILEHTQYDYQKSLSDISGWDIHAHGGDHIKAVRHVRNWLLRQANADPTGPAKILSDYATFQEWYWERELGRGSSEEDIKSYPTVQMVDAMREWVDKGRPT